MLKGIPNNLSPQLLKILMEMGHGDEIVLADANFPAVSCAKQLVRCDGNDIPSLLESIMKLLPLDEYTDDSVMLMDVVKDDPVKTPIWKVYEDIINKYESCQDFKLLERFEFYEQARKAYAIVATSETAQYANIILRKGVIRRNGEENR